MQTIKNKVFPNERDLYGISDTIIDSCRFEGVEDGESALKETNNIKVVNCAFVLRYPMWHVNGLTIENSTMVETCRAPLWYSNNIFIKDCNFNTIKALRECNNIEIASSNIASSEFGWNCSNIKVNNSTITSEYIFMNCNDIELKNFELFGKYSFQYTNNLRIKNSKLHTKDSFWHTKNAIIENCLVEGEYLAWYSDSLTFINCEIKGTQPFCYCKNLKLVNCKLVDCDLAFEYSNVEADITGNVISIKNPTSGSIRYESCDKIILENSKYPLNCKLIKK